MRRLVSFSVRPDFCVMVALSLFILPVKWVAGWLIAAGIHELFHLWMMRILKIRVLSISLGAGGAVIASDPMTSFRELLCALAGPVGGLSALLLLRVMPHIALCAAVQSAYNLLPVYPLDGGRAVKCTAECLLGEENAEKVSHAITIIVLLLLTSVGFGLSYRYQLGLLPIIFPVVPLICSVYKNSLQSRENNSTM